ncbi:MAG: hypothetical protein ABL889_01995 [Terricaulis sp.]
MGRLVSAQRRGAQPYSGAAVSDGYMERVAKYIPGETLAVYVALQSFLTTPAPWWYALYLLLFVGTFAYVWRQRTPGQPWQLHAILASIGFVVWSYALHADAKFSPFFESGYNNELAGALVIIFPFAIGFLVPQAQTSALAPASAAAAPQPAPSQSTPPSPPTSPPAS